MLSDTSSLNRLVDSWKIAFTAPVYGLGLIDTTEYVLSTTTNIGINSYGNMYINNIFAAIYLFGGPISLFFFAIYLKSVTKKNIWGFIFLILLCVASGNFNAGITWAQIVLVAVCSISIKQEKRIMSNQSTSALLNLNTKVVNA